jgi:DNA-binding NarL/FixJ family response regulator
MPVADPEQRCGAHDVKKRGREGRDILDVVFGRDATRDAGLTGAETNHRMLEQRRHSKPRDAVEIWQAVVAGRWSLLEHFDSEGHRCFLTRQNLPHAPCARALSEREVRIVAHASRGHSNKHIAYELGLCSSTVAAQLTSAQRKLGVSSRETLLHAFAVLGGDILDHAILSEPSGRSTPRHRDDDPSIRVVRFRHNEQDYAMIQLAIAPQLPPSLTVAEAEVAALVIKGLPNAAIAKQRKTSVRTVANQLRSIFAKLAVGSRRQLCSQFSLPRGELETWSETSQPVLP